MHTCAAHYLSLRHTCAVLQRVELLAGAAPDRMCSRGKWLFSFLNWALLSDLGLGPSPQGAAAMWRRVCPAGNRQGTSHGACSHSGEEFHSCVPGWDATVHFPTAFATAAHTSLDKRATSPSPCVGDRRCQSGSMGERESNTANQFWGPFEHSSWVRLNRLLSGLTSFTAVHRLGLLSSPHCDGRAASRRQHLAVEECPVQHLQGVQRCLAALGPEAISWLQNPVSA
ncbi:unnamed protein product [Lepidochelys kempii]